MNEYRSPIRRTLESSTTLLAKVALLVLLVLLTTSPAAAEAGLGRIEAIRAQMEQGQALYLAQKYPEAAAVFEKGYEDYPYSAFLFNAGVAYEKSEAFALAIQRFRRYLEIDPNAPDADAVRKRVQELEARVKGQDGKSTGPKADSPAVEEASATSVMKSLIWVETEPPGAPLSIFLRKDSKAAPFLQGAPNTGWVLTKRAESPLSLALAVGRYHIVVDKFRDFNVSEADIDVLPGHVHHFKANLSQGAFMAFLRVSSNVEGAYVFLEEPNSKTLPWGRAPYGELVPAGPQTIWVDAPGYEPQKRAIELEHGQQRELDIILKRVSYGFLRVTATSPMVEVTVDGIPMGSWKRGREPLELRLAVGTHLLRIESEDRKAFEGFVQVPAGQILPIRAVMQQTYPRTAAWTQAVLGVAFLGGATYVGLESNKLHDELSRDARAGTLDAEDERITRGRWFAIGADAGFVIGGTLGLLATYNFVRDPLPESQIELLKAMEFDDPRAPAPPDEESREVPPVPAAKEPSASASPWFFGSEVGQSGLGLSIGGHF